MSCKRQLLKMRSRPDRNRTTCFLKDEYRLDSIDLTGRSGEQNSNDNQERHYTQ